MRRCPLALPALMLLLAWDLAAVEPSAAVTLTPAIARWKRQMEDLGNGKVILVRVYTDPERNQIILPNDAGQRPILRRYFLDETFIAQFVAAHALSINYEGIEGKFHFVLLNMARSEEWRGAEEALLAHEFGHIWLHLLRYPTPAYEPGPEACVNTLASDVLQHILLRREYERRGIAFASYWLRNLDTALAALERTDAEPRHGAPFCQKLAQLVLWMDVRLGLSSEQWASHSRFLRAMERNFPELKPYADRLEELLRGTDVADRDAHLQALQQTLKIMYELVDSHSLPRPSAALTHP